MVLVALIFIYTVYRVAKVLQNSDTGETRGYDWDSGYTCHQLGSGAIVVQLAQPYVSGYVPPR